MFGFSIRPLADWEIGKLARPAQGLYTLRPQYFPGPIAHRCSNLSRNEP